MMNAKMELALCDQKLDGSDKEARNLLRMMILLQTIPNFLAYYLENEKIADEANQVIRYVIGLWGLPDKLMALFDPDWVVDATILDVRSRCADVNNLDKLSSAA